MKIKDILNEIRFFKDPHAKWGAYRTNKVSTGTNGQPIDYDAVYKSLSQVRKKPKHIVMPDPFAPGTGAKSTGISTPATSQHLPSSPPTPSKPKISRTTDGSIIITDKDKQTWTNPAGKNYWIGPNNAVYMPGSKEYTTLTAFNKNLNEVTK